MPRLIREATVSDLPSIQALDAESFGEPYSLTVLRQLLDVTGPFFIVSETESEIEGYAVAVKGATSESEAWILALAVSKRVRRQKVGATLTRALLERLESNRVPSVLLTVNPENTGALALYTAEGFTEEGYEHDYFGPGEPRRVLRRSG
jgi:ribosomal-protein-alanine N-acetyltransferase